LVTVRSGAHTPWQEWDGEHGPEGVVLFRDGQGIGDPDLLVEAVRSDGISSGLAEAYRFVDHASYVYGFYGFVDGSNIPTACDMNGMTDDGEEVEVVVPCVFASIGVSS
jgi:hypothetical protein